MGDALGRRAADARGDLADARAAARCIGRLDALLKPFGLTFARYEALVLLTFSSRGSLPLGQDGRAAAGAPHVGDLDRRPARGDRARRTTSASGGRAGRARRDHRRPGTALVEEATAELVGADFGLGALDDDGLRELSALLRPVRQAAGDF